jgi:hypothetical protein
MSNREMGMRGWEEGIVGGGFWNMRDGLRGWMFLNGQVFSSFCNETHANLHRRESTPSLVAGGKKL